MGFHSNNFSTHQDQCGSCAISEVSDRRLECYCNKYRTTYRLSEPKCRDYVKDHSRDYDFWRRIYTYYVLTAIFDIMNIDKNNSLYITIKTMIDAVREDESTKKEAIGYNTFGLELADKLRNDQDSENISNYLFYNYIIDVYCLIELNKMEEAIEKYKDMVKFLFIRYRNIDNYAELIDSKRFENPKILVK